MHFKTDNINGGKRTQEMQLVLPGMLSFHPSRTSQILAPFF
jgi:hypothetical protein